MRPSVRRSVVGLAAALVAVAAFAAPDGDARGAAGRPRIFLIGNSLTWDTLPGQLDGADVGRVRWHVFCGKNLRFIHDHPDKHCVDSSTPWPEALAEPTADYLVIQPHMGTTLAEDAALIAEWAETQPDAVLVVHTAWLHFAKFSAAYASTRADPGAPMKTGPAYFDALLAALRDRLPGREIRATNCYRLLHSVDEDVAAGRGPFAKLTDLGRDEIHMNLGPGRYLMHNAMRRALGQPPGDEGFDLDPDVKRYLDEKLSAHGWTPPAPQEPPAPAADAPATDAPAADAPAADAGQDVAPAA